MIRVAHAGDLARDEVLAAARRLVVEQDAVDGEQPVGLAVVDGLPMGVDLGAGVGAARMKRRGLALRSLGDLAEHLGGPGLIEAHLAVVPLVVIADRLEQSERAQPDHVGGVLRLVEGDPDVRLRRQIVDFVGPGLLDYPSQPGAVAEVAVMKLKPLAGLEALAEMIDPPRGEAGSAAHDAVDLVALVQEQFGDIRAVLTGDTSDQCDPGHRADSTSRRPHRGPKAALFAISVTWHQAMGVAVEMLRRELQQLGVFERQHLMDQAPRHVHAFAGLKLEFLYRRRLGRFLYEYLEPAGAQVERFGLELVKVQRTALALFDLENLAAVEVVVRDPYLSAPSFGYDPDRLTNPAHL